jgi:alkylation response protein AidB-like acyl-CoA dehydrogenase
VKFELSDQQQEWQAEVRDFLRHHLTDAVRAEVIAWHGHGHGPRTRDFYKAVADRNWTALTWPASCGGMERGAIDQFILAEEFEYAGAPRVEMTWTSLAPLLIRYGTDANRALWLEDIRSGDILFALGYSESEAGTDLASLRTTARRDGDEWAIDGEKTWNTGAHFATHEWLAVRTNAEARRHRGISLIVVPIGAPGVQTYPILTWSGVRTSRVVFTNVRVPADNLVGEVDRGWAYITGALDFERATIGGHVGSLRRLVDGLVQYAGEQKRDGRLLRDDPAVRSGLAELALDVELAGLMGLEVADAIDRGQIPTLPGTVQKVFTTELRTKVADVGMRLLGQTALLSEAEPDAPLGGFLEWTYRWAPVQRFGGGTNEVMRDIIAQRGLGLPRAARGQGR